MFDMKLLDDDLGKYLDILEVVWETFSNKL